MKKSNKIFVGLVGLLLLAVIYPPITGNYMSKRDNTDQPSDFLSKFWKSFDDTVTTKVLDKSFRHVKVVGDGRDASGLSLDFNRSKSNTVRGRKLKYFAAEINGDTLVVKQLSGELRFLEVSLANRIESLTIENCYLSLKMDSVAFSATPSFIVANRSKFYFSGKSKQELDSLSSLKIAVSGESKVNLLEASVFKVDATIDNGLVRYWPAFEADTMDVTLTGKSSVSAVNPTMVHAVKNLIVRKDKKYFNPNLVGKNVNLISQND